MGEELAHLDVAMASGCSSSAFTAAAPQQEALCAGGEGEGVGGALLVGACTAVAQALSYVALSSALQLGCFRASCWHLPVLTLLRGERHEKQVATDRGGVPRHPLHPLYATINLATSAACAGAVAAAYSLGWTRLRPDGTAVEAVGALVAAVAWQSVLEYYWHLIMHVPAVYKRWHKLHHHNKRPRPFDDLFIHPLESLGYSLILYSPAVVVGGPLVGFLAYMAIMGVAGVLDHSGVPLSCGIYDTVAHEMHHVHFVVNYAFPFAALDVLHGTAFQGKVGS